MANNGWNVYGRNMNMWRGPNGSIHGGGGGAGPLPVDPARERMPVHAEADAQPIARQVLNGQGAPRDDNNARRGNRRPHARDAGAPFGDYAPQPPDVGLPAPAVGRYDGFDGVTVARGPAAGGAAPIELPQPEPEMPVERKRTLDRPLPAELRVGPVDQMQNHLSMRMVYSAHERGEGLIQDCQAMTPEQIEHVKRGVIDSPFLNAAGKAYWQAVVDAEMSGSEPPRIAPYIERAKQEACAKTGAGRNQFFLRRSTKGRE